MRHEYSDRVKELYGKYPRKTGCASVAAKIDRMADEEYREVCSGISWQAALYRRRAARSQLGWAAVPHFTTWINQRGWEAEEVDGFSKPEEVRQKTANQDHGCRNCGYKLPVHNEHAETKAMLAQSNHGRKVCENYQPLSEAEAVEILRKWLEKGGGS